MRPPAEVDLMIFEVAGDHFGVDLTQVLRIDTDQSVASIGAPLGVPRVGRRAMVFRSSEGAERRLLFDSMVSTRKVATTDLRRMPKVAAAASFSIGVWLNGEQPVILVDLPSMASSLRKASTS
jgi:hypothetical protein